jgi:hypothetical protein
MSAKEERYPMTWGHANHGTITSGHLNLSDDNSLQSDVKSGLRLQARDSRHYMSMDVDGPREGWTLNRCPGTYQIRCATDVHPDSFGYYVDCENGDIVLNAGNGNIRLYGMNVIIHAKYGPDNTNGVIEIESNQKVNIDTQLLNIKAHSGVKIFTPYTMDLVANTTLNLISNFVDGLTSASSTKPNKANPLTTNKMFAASNYT